MASVTVNVVPVQGFNVPQRVVMTTEPERSSTPLLCSPSTALSASLVGEFLCATRFSPSRAHAGILGIRMGPTPPNWRG